MLPTKLIFVEGIMGAGKSTTAKFLAHRLPQQQISARLVSESWEAENPLRVAWTLPHPWAVWQDVTSDQYIDLSLQKWQAFVADAQASHQVSVLDGLLFHGNLTDVLMMDATSDVLRDYVERVIEALVPLHPVIIYLRQPSVSHALRVVCDERGPDWEKHQVDWKVASPYSVQRNWQGYEGLVKLYQDYRIICDDIFAQLSIPKVTLDTTMGDWSHYYHEILTFLQVSTK